MSFAMRIILFCVAILISYQATASPLAVVDNGTAVVVGTFEGQVQYWRAGAQKPAWAVNTHGDGWGARAPIAALGEMPGGDIVVVERYGNIVRFSNKGDLIDVKRPVYEGIWMKVPFTEINWQHWGQQVERVASTSAAFLSRDGSLFLTSERGMIHKVALQAIMQGSERTVILADMLAFYTKDALAICMQLKPSSKPIAHVGTWGTWDGLKEATALTSCSGTLIAGGADGYVGLLRESAADSQDLRLRQVGEGSGDTRSILDAGCLNNEYAYTLSFEAGHGQIQLWNLQQRAASSWVGSDTKGHPGMAFAAVPSAKGDLLLSTGDHDVRLWNVTEGKLNLKAAHFFDEAEPQSFAAGALQDGDFVYWDGSRLWRIPGSGASPVLYAGPLANKAAPRK